MTTKQFPAWRFIPMLWLAVLLGCNGGEAPTEPRVTLSPTPFPIPQIAGSWSGTLDGLCFLDPYVLNVTAELAQDGNRVTGHFTGSGSFHRNECRLTGDFNGGVSLGRLSGMIETISVQGTATENELVLNVSNSPYLFGKVTLHR